MSEPVLTWDSFPVDLYASIRTSVVFEIVGKFREVRSTIRAPRNEVSTSSGGHAPRSTGVRSHGQALLGLDSSSERVNAFGEQLGSAQPVRPPGLPLPPGLPHPPPLPIRRSQAQFPGQLSSPGTPPWWAACRRSSVQSDSSYKSCRSQPQGGWASPILNTDLGSSCQG